MGLDITHYKATLKRPEKIDPFNRYFMIEEEFEGFDENFQYFEKCIQIIETPNTLKTIIFPKREHEIDEVKSFLKDGEYTFLFEKNLNHVNDCFQKHLEGNNLNENLVHSWTTDKWIGFHVYEMHKQVGFYFEEVGYQRKGINENFWTRFDSERITSFTKQEDFEFALTCVDFYWDTDTIEEVTLRRQLFKKNFVDNYEQNKSWMDINY